MVCLAALLHHSIERIGEMINRYRNLTIWVVAVLMVSSGILSGPVYSATQGTLGATSTGSVTISVTKPARANISDLNDLTVASWVTGGGTQVLTDDVCVYSTRPSGGYTIRATGSGAASAFTLANGANLLAYTVIWNSGGVGALANTGTALTNNVTSATLTKAARDSSTCIGTVPGPTARLVVTILATALDAAVDGTYTGTLTLLITPA